MSLCVHVSVCVSVYVQIATYNHLPTTPTQSIIYSTITELSFRLYQTQHHLGMVTPGVRDTNRDVQMINGQYQVDYHTFSRHTDDTVNFVDTKKRNENGKGNQN